MSCDCKKINNGDEMNGVIVGYYDKMKLPFCRKVNIIFDFLQFYFYFVMTSVMNFIINDKLEPSIPKRLLRKYNGQ